MTTNMDGRGALSTFNRFCTILPQFLPTVGAGNMLLTPHIGNPPFLSLTSIPDTTSRHFLLIHIMLCLSLKPFVLILLVSGHLTVCRHFLLGRLFVCQHLILQWTPSVTSLHTVFLHLLSLPTILYLHPPLLQFPLLSNLPLPLHFIPPFLSLLSLLSLLLFPLLHLLYRPVYRLLSSLLFPRPSVQRRRLSLSQQPVTPIQTTGVVVWRTIQRNSQRKRFRNHCSTIITAIVVDQMARKRQASHCRHTSVEGTIVKKRSISLLMLPLLSCSQQLV